MGLGPEVFETLCSCWRHWISTRRSSTPVGIPERMPLLCALQCDLYPCHLPFLSRLRPQIIYFCTAPHSVSLRTHTHLPLPFRPSWSTQEDTMPTTPSTQCLSFRSDLSLLTTLRDGLMPIY